MTQTTLQYSTLPQRKEAALRIAVLTTFLSLMPTIYAALTSNSIILLADLLRCLVEFIAIFISWLILLRMVRGTKRRYDYGYGKLEQFSSILVALAMLVTFGVVIFAALSRLVTPEPVTNSGFGTILAFLSVVGNLTLCIYYRTLSKQTGSALLDSQWRLFRAKTLASVIVLLSLLPVFLGSDSALIIYADPIGSLLLAGYLLYSSIGLMVSSTHELLDCSLEESLQLMILRMLVQFDADYRGLKQIRSRRSGGRIIIELFLEFDPNLPLKEVQDRSDRMKAYLNQSIPDSEIILIPSV